MAISSSIQYARLGDLYLDPRNPRLGRRNTQRGLSQSEILDLISTWELEELGTSFLRSGFWPQEAPLVVKERLGGTDALVVVEGNRRLAALQLLKQSFGGQPPSKTWERIVDGASPPTDLFDKIPYIQVDSRKDIEAFLGFRHVTGIKEWHPEEKAEYIARLIDENQYNYDDVMRLIGSKTPTVRLNYIAYNIAKQLEEVDDYITDDAIAGRFSVFYLSLRTPGVQQFLGFDPKAAPNDAREPVPKENLERLKSFGRWIFGLKDLPPFLSDSRQVDRFGDILTSDAAVKYLQETAAPDFSVASKIAGGEQRELLFLVNGARSYVEQALSRAYLYNDSEELHAAASQLLRAVQKLVEQLAPDPTAEGARQ